MDFSLHPLRQPVIIIGMHRSGTSMTTRLIEQLGLFTGNDTARNAESHFFLRLNMWLVTQPSGSWANPEPFDDLLASETLREPIRNYLRDRATSFRAAEYLGFRKWLKYRSLSKLDFPWGWKDPNNTFTLPLWLEMFPEAKVLHIQRNGVDVAASLQHRAKKEFLHRYQKWQRLKPYFRLKKPKQPFATVQTWYLENGLGLWERYVVRARHHIEQLPGERTMQFRYEDFLAEPYSHLSRIAEWLDLPCDHSDITSATRKVDASRAYAFASDPELSQFARTNSVTLQRFGYKVDEIIT